LLQQSGPHSARIKPNRLIRGAVPGLLRRQQLCPHLLLDLAGQLLVLLQEGPGVVLALADPAALVAVPGADFSTMPWALPRSMISPSREIPAPYMISNSASRNGGATLFLTTFTRVMLPVTSSPFLIAPMRRMSKRTDA